MYSVTWVIFNDMSNIKYINPYMWEAVQRINLYSMPLIYCNIK